MRDEGHRSDEPANREEVTMQGDFASCGFGPDLASIGPPLEVLPLATLLMPQGTEVRFLGVPALGEVGIVEELIGDIDAAPTLCGEPTLSPLDMYTRFAPADAPVPTLLLRDSATTEEDFESLKRRFSSRETVEEPISVSGDEFSNISGALVARGSPRSDCHTWNCSSGFQEFRSFACEGSYPGSAVRFCDATANSNFLDRWTDARRRYSLSITAVCDTTIGYVRHYHRMPGYWAKVIDYALPGNRACWVRWKGIWGPGGRRARWVRHGVLNTPAGAYFRAFTAMYND